MKVLKTGLLLASLLSASSAIAYVSPEPASASLVKFYNNTDVQVRVQESSFTNGLITCQGAPFHLCIQSQPDITISPHGTGVIPLITAITTPEMPHSGGVTFSIFTEDQSRINVIIPVTAAFVGAFNDAAGFGDLSNSQSENRGFYKKLPKYVAVAAQSVRGGISEGGMSTAWETVISINLLRQ